LKAIILGQRGGWHTESLIASLSRRGVEPECVPVTRLTAAIGGTPRLSVQDLALDARDVVFVRAVPSGSLEQVIFRMDALRVLESEGVRVVNSARAIERGVDKYYAAALLEGAGLPTPRTIVCERFDDALAAVERLGGDVVLKPLFGSEGRGMVRVSDTDTAYRALRALELGRYIYCVQEYVPHGLTDIRAFVVGDRVIGAMTRRGKHWKTNAAQGASVEPCDLSPDLRDMSVRAARAVGADHAGVDILRCDSGGHSIVEVNTIPGWRALLDATGVDAGQELVDHVLARTS
jgi:RimK family alpha-L-glutamate ligase